jgi:hypothetical protein
MRLLELRANGVGSPTLEFHPNLTIVYGMSPVGRELVISAVSSLPAGVDTGLGGLVEAHGILFDLSSETLEILGMSEDVDVVVRADDLPGVEDDEPMASVTPLFGDAPTPSPEPAVDLAVLREEVERARRTFLDSKEALEVMVDAFERAKVERAAAIEASQRIQTALEKARRERDIARAQRDGKVDESLSATGRDRQLRERLEQLQVTVRELEEAIRELEERDPRPIQVLVDALHQPQSDRLVPSQEAISLADEFAELQGQLDELERRLQADGLSMDQLSQRLEDSRFEVTQAERAVSKPEVTDTDIAELEAVHDEALEAERRASGRVGRKAAMKKLEETKAREQVILDRIGFPTWAAYVMGSSLLNIDPIAEQRLEQARQELLSAEEAWALLTQQLEADPDYAGLLDRLEAVFLAAFDLLGGETEGDLEDRLRNLLVPDEEVSRDDIIEALAYQLTLREVEVEEGAAAETVEGLAEQWLAVTADHWDKYRTLQEEHVAVSNELAATESELQLLSGDPDLDTPEERQRKYETAEARVAEILSDLEGVSEIVAELDGQVEARDLLTMPSELTLQAAQAALTAAEERLAEAEAATAVSGSPGPTGSLPPSYDRKPEIYDDLPYAAEDDDEEMDREALGAADDEIEFYFLSRMAALRGRSHAGSVPLIIDEALAGRSSDEVLRVLGQLERMSESVQVIYLTEDDAVIEWADSVGLQRAAAVTPQGDFG